MKNTTITLDAVPVEQEVLRADQYLRLARKNPGLIKSSTIVHPKPGQDGFGEFLVKYTRPIYKVPNPLGR